MSKRHPWEFSVERKAERAIPRTESLQAQLDHVRRRLAEINPERDSLSAFLEGAPKNARGLFTQEEHISAVRKIRALRVERLYLREQKNKLDRAIHSQSFVSRIPEELSSQEKRLWLLRRLDTNKDIIEGIERRLAVAKKDGSGRLVESSDVRSKSKLHFLKVEQELICDEIDKIDAE